MQPHQIDLGFVIGNTLSDLSWTGFTFVCALGLIFVLWCVLPFAVFGVKRRLDAIESAQRHQTELLATELRRTNEILARRVSGVATPDAAVDAWHAVPAAPQVVAARSQPVVMAPVVAQAVQPQQQYAPYPDDPRPAPPTPRRDVRWTRFGQQGANGSAA